ncbi:probable arabinosyltransferase ARAD1 isoform X2 [Henckelia pumila]|uniref:probable arabinosyltransferase ARAD1 isoform X2 n=1 Tax=Henckelia pumila TaxID=405737 RepID=UPI003C6E426F
MSKMGFFTHRYLFHFFLLTSAVFILSWLLVLRSAGRTYSIDYYKLLSIAKNNNLYANLQARASINEEAVILSRNSRKCDSSEHILKVFMYDLPSEFHFNLLGWKGRGRGVVWPDIRSEVPDYPGGLNLQHSIEYWLTLDLLNSEFTKNLGGRSAIRVHNSSEADVVFVPFFSSICYNRYSKLKPNQKRSINSLLQEKLVTFLTAQDEWKRSGGNDHIVMAHHPNSLLDARTKLWPAMFILSDFDDASDFDSRKTLLYFQGAIYRKDGGIIRQELYYMLKNEKDVHFAFGSVQKDGVKQASTGMRSSKFCLNIAGDTPSSNRLFDAIASHCVPVIISDEIELPYEDALDYSEFCVFVRTSDALKEKFLLNLVRNITKADWTRMWGRLKEVENFYKFQYPSQANDAVQMIWQAVSRKVPAVKLKIHRTGRFSGSITPIERRD